MLSTVGMLWTHLARLFHSNGANRKPLALSIRARPFALKTSKCGIHLHRKYHYRLVLNQAVLMTVCQSETYTHASMARRLYLATRLHNLVILVVRGILNPLPTVSRG